jgi:RND family efflux transporter MFP subunit
MKDKQVHTHSINKQIMRNVLTIALITLLVASCGTNANQPAPERKSEKIPVKVADIGKGIADDRLESSGYLSTEDEARLAFKVGGVIDKIYVREGEKIRKGQLLASLKSTEISAQVQQVELQVEKARRDYARVQNLYRDSVATLEQLQNAKTGLEIAEQGLRAAGFNQQFARIYATGDGFVVRQLKNEGEMTEGGAPLLITREVSATSQWVLTVGLSDREWASVQRGDSAILSFDAFPGKTFSGIVHRKALSANPSSGAFETELRVDFGKEQPAAGIFGRARIRVHKPVEGFSIPYDALLEANGKQGFVFVTNDGKTVQRVPVTIGTISQQVVYLVDGLEGYKQVVISGSPYLTDGSAIQVIQ